VSPTALAHSKYESKDADERPCEQHGEQEPAEGASGLGPKKSTEPQGDWQDDGYPQTTHAGGLTSERGADWEAISGRQIVKPTGGT